MTAKRDWNYPPQSANEEKYGELKAYKLKGAYVTETLYIGDSNMEQYAPRIEYLTSSNPNAQSAAFLTHGGCLPLPNLINKNKKVCTGMMEAVQAYIDHNSVSKVVIGGRWNKNLTTSERYYVFADGSKAELSTVKGRDAALSALKNFIITLRKKGIEVYIVHNIPSDLPELEGAKVNRLKLALGLIEPSSYNFPDTHDKIGAIDQDVRQYIDRLAKDSGAKLIDPIAFFCKKDSCRLADKEFPRFYKDAGHLAASFVKERVTYLDETVLLKKEK